VLNFVEELQESFASFNTKIHQHLTHKFNIDRPLGFISNAAARLQLKSDHNSRRVNYTHTYYFPKTLNETPTKNPNS
jgi:hypothetical protein